VGALMAYAEKTSVPVERSRSEIERILTRYGAVRFGSMTEPDKATIYFEVKGRQVQIPIAMPDPGDKRFTHDARSTYRRVSDTKRDQRVEAERRRRWRVLVITVKAMLEAVESKLLTFDQAFLAHIVIPGRAMTLGEAITPKLDALYSGVMSLPALLSENPKGGKP
jgi:hypothetical protein